MLADFRRVTPLPAVAVPLDGAPARRSPASSWARPSSAARATRVTGLPILRPGALRAGRRTAPRSSGRDGRGGMAQAGFDERRAPAGRGAGRRRRRASRACSAAGTGRACWPRCPRAPRRSTGCRRPKGPLAFRCASAEAVKAAARFVYDEPETIWWIDHVVQPGDCVWDVGANVGLYALYAALRVGESGPRWWRSSRAADNYAALCRNVALTAYDGVVQRLLRRPVRRDPAAAAPDQPGRRARRPRVRPRRRTPSTGPRRGRTCSAALGFSADAFTDQFQVRAPDHLKIDVDSIEERIVRGGASAASPEPAR